MRSIRVLIMLPFIFNMTLASAASKKEITYFQCNMKEGRTEVQIKFAVKGYDSFNGSGELVNYPGTKDEYQPIVVTPEQIGKVYPMAFNLNSQGGDLTVERHGDIRLFGDGDGYQFTDLVVWANLDDEETTYEGYIRDYGPTYGEKAPFKQFITCKSSKKPL